MREISKGERKFRDELAELAEIGEQMADKMTEKSEDSYYEFTGIDSRLRAIITSYHCEDIHDPPIVQEYKFEQKRLCQVFGEAEQSV